MVSQSDEMTTNTTVDKVAAASIGEMFESCLSVLIGEYLVYGRPALNENRIVKFFGESKGKFETFAKKSVRYIRSKNVKLGLDVYRIEYEFLLKEFEVDILTDRRKIPPKLVDAVRSAAKTVDKIPDIKHIREIIEHLSQDKARQTTTIQVSSLGLSSGGSKADIRFNIRIMYGSDLVLEKVLHYSVKTSSTRIEGKKIHAAIKDIVGYIPLDIEAINFTSADTKDIWFSFSDVITKEINKQSGKYDEKIIQMFSDAAFGKKKDTDVKFIKFVNKIKDSRLLLSDRNIFVTRAKLHFKKFKAEPAEGTLNLKVSNDPRVVFRFQYNANQGKIEYGIGSAGEQFLNDIVRIK